MPATLPLLYVSLAFLLGILLGSAYPWTWGVWLILAAAFPALVFGLQRLALPDRLRRVPAWLWRSWSVVGLAPVVLVSSLFVGAARYQAAQPTITPAHLAWFNDQGPALIRGTVISPPDQRDSYTLLRIRALRITPLSEGENPPYQEVSGQLLVRTAPDSGWRYGDVVLVEGLPETPPEDEDFSYKDYLARQGINTYIAYAQVSLRDRDQGSWFLAQIYSLQRRLLEVVYLLFPAPESALLAGILLGVEQGIPADLQQAFKDTGTAHIIAISGFNITILAGLLTLMFSRWLGPRRGALLAVVGIGLYTLLVGAQASVVRAALMGWIALLARQMGRRQVGVNTLGFTAMVMCLFNPHWLWDAGFQLSFFATLGLVLFAEPLQAGFNQLLGRFFPQNTLITISGPVGEYLLFTLAAQITTLPLVAYHFGRLSLVSFLANPLVLPPQPLVMVLGGIAAILGLIYLPLGQLAAALAWPFVAYTIRMVEWWDRLPGGVLEIGQFSLLLAVAYYAVVLGWAFAREQLHRLNWSARPLMIIVPLLALTSLVWQAALTAPDGKLQVTVFDSGSSQVLLIQTPTGRSLLVNGGASASQLMNDLGRRLPFTQPGLDALILTSSDNADLTALPRTLRRHTPDFTLWAGEPGSSRAGRTLETALVEADIPIVPMEAGQSLDLGEGAVLRVVAYNPSDDLKGVVLQVEWRSFRLLLPFGEATVPGEVGSVSGLLLTDRIQDDLDAWLERLQPQVVLLSAGANDRLDQEALAALERYNLLTTYENGWIELTTDGEQMWLEVERK